MNLELLIEEQSLIKEKISETLKKTKQWFKDKLNEINLSFSRVKYKVKEKLSSFTKSQFKDTICKEKMEVKVDGKKVTICNTGESGDKAFERIKRLLDSLIDKLKKICNDVRLNCSNALKHIIVVEKIDYEAIEREKRLAEERERKLEELSILKDKVKTGIIHAGEIVGLTFTVFTMFNKIKIMSNSITNK